MQHPKIVILDAKYANPGDLSWDPIEQLGETTIYEQTSTAELIERSKEAEVLIINKMKLGAKEFAQLPHLKMVAISATGMDNVDIDAAKKADIVVTNVDGYSTNSVVQHVFALLLSLVNNVDKHDLSVRNGDWNEEAGFSYTLQTIPELAGKKLGIYGLGRIGQKVAEIGLAFGMEIYAASGHATPEMYPHYHLVDVDQLFEVSDVISLHAPLTAGSKEMVNRQLIGRMKKEAYLINTARGGLINESDLAEALNNEQIAGAGLDVLSEEPPAKDHPLLQAKSCIITPHMAWTSKAARKKLIEGVAQQIKKHLNRA